jgi:ribonuclease Z
LIFCHIACHNRIVKLTLLGTGSPIPDPNRAGPSTLVEAGGHQLLFDAGRGVLMRLAGAGVLPPMLRAVLLTHQHSDHVTDFNDVFTMRWAMSPTPNPLPVIGPPGTTTFVERTATMLTHDIGYRIAHHDDLHDPPVAHTTEVLDEVALEVGVGGHCSRRTGALGDCSRSRLLPISSREQRSSASVEWQLRH